ncbi:hypothetical protein H9Q69_002315 [Fusarium xylarioides]|nr:hypothetical protein H9Q70_005352 [Fusarium xylarioides]KAG5780823.1 hypothetical protein H9Q73_005535 [Fusarium xylarioides]KAG5798646.1 hypothetical protein H9Q69_002315 [Fusarium xylarioides]KAG5802383.1 hypothetical protein H9Q71_013030 [Fusarium xylarioides]KAG5812509.1 hypothetical protein H9Q74_013092 [Fusarium xylarioides]
MSSNTISQLPTAEQRENITARLADLITAIESHSQWTPPNVDRGLFHVWDFVKRSHYIMTELDNIAAGRQVQHPEQIPKNEGVASGPEAALASYTDVCTRTITINEMIQNPRMLVMLGLSNVDFGSAIQEKSAAVKEAIKSAN